MFSTHLSNPHLSHLFVPSPTDPPFFFDGDLPEQMYPADRITLEDFVVYNDRVVIDGQYTYARFTDTGSMEPVFGVDSHTLMREVTAAEEIAVGDILAYVHYDMEYPVIHRVVFVGNDEEGWYAVTQGDNVDGVDRDKVRFNQVLNVVVGVLY